MSLTTRCPACGTTFKVVPDQLRISEGWVRCGQCAEVFDANTALKPAAGAAPTRTPSPPPAPAAPAASSNWRGDGPADRSAAREAQGKPQAAEPPPSGLLRRDADEPDSRTLVNDTQPPNEPPVLASRFLADDGDDDLDEEVSFARRRPLPRVERRGMRTVLKLAALGFGALLILQVALHDRDRLAATHKGLRPALEALCKPLGCTLGPPRMIESLAIDSSTFSKLRSDAYRLSLTLKNQAPMEVAMPAIELTLTDTQDQPVVRRVLLPAELAAGTPVIAAGAEWSGTLALSVAASADSGRIAGYRLLAFYP